MPMTRSSRRDETPHPMIPNADDLRQRAARIRLAAFDVDGVLTDGSLWFGPDGQEVKGFHVHDGLGLKLLEEAGIAVAFISARNSSVAAARARELGIVRVHQGERDKRTRLTRLCEELGIGSEQASYMGDDLPDLAPLSIAGLAIAPANAHPWVAARVHWQTRRAGGAGAVREACDLILEAQGHADAVLARHLGQGG